MTTEELAELFLTHLYDLAEAAPHPNYLFTLNDFVPMLGITDGEQLQQAINSLGDRGFIIMASFDAFGGISAGITIEGSVFVEQGGETGVIEQYRQDPQRFVKVRPEPPSQPVSESEDQKAIINEEKPPLFTMGRAVEAILADIEDTLKRDNTVGAEIKKDLLADVDTLRIQMGRKAKNKPVIEAIMSNLSGLPSVAPLVSGLKSIVQAYLE
ncbi:MAG: hypothetical protein C0407_01025 [Desulfobacca sp.]|nr:hypothetical protein [Desulfobacca sp.]